MAGIIQDQQNHEPGEDEATENETPKVEASEVESREITPQNVRGQLQLKPEQMDTYQKIVAAGRKIMYSPEFDNDIAQLMAGEGDIGQKLGHGVVAVLAMLITKANGTLPGELIIPAGTELVADAGQMLEESGQKVTDKDVAAGIAAMVSEIMQRSGIDEAKLPELLGQGQPPTAPEGAQPPEEA